MKYYKQTSEGYIIVISTGCGGEEITEAEYNEIMAIIQNCPHEEGKNYRLRTDLTWEEYDNPAPLPPDPDEEIEPTVTLHT